MKEYLLKLCPNKIHRLYGDIKFWIRFHFFRKGLISEEFKGLLGYDMDWNNPEDINQKINWMKIYYDTSEWSILADKLAVRDYVIERIGEEHLPRVYGVWNNPEEIDFEKLPQKFVLKTNHGAGTVILVNDKDTVDRKEIISKLKKWCNLRFGYKTIEPHYLRIKPLVYAEEFLANDKDFSSSIVDYKVFCLNGIPYCILICKDREIGKHTKLSFYDCDWNPIPDMLAGSHSGEFSSIPQPKCLHEMLNLSNKLAFGHPQVRLDFYIVGDKVLLGEMTFTSQGGYMDYIAKDYCKKMGSLIPIP